VSGYDILFFWIARMIMAGLHFTGEIPYRDIFITGMIKDKLGRWMSKSLGNGIDPLEMIEEYGADAVRYSLTILCAQGQDIKLDPTKFEMGRNFANKIWNAFNVFGQFMEPGRQYRRTREYGELDLVEQWILHRLNTTIERVNESVDRYRLNEALSSVYDVFWRDFCDWYLELIKPPRGSSMEDERIALAVELYEKMILLLHPFMPFITEDLWQRVRPRGEGESCMVQEWPAADLMEKSDSAAETFSVIQEMVSGIRNIRAEYSVPPSKHIGVIINVSSKEPDLLTALESHRDYFEKLARVDQLEVGSGRKKPIASASAVVGRNVVFIPLSGMIDLSVERDRLQKEIDQKEDFVVKIQKKLQNRQFVSKAPAEVVERERKKEADTVAELKRLRANLEDLARVN
jgi:valyl-tRNA synthetase